MRIVLLVSGQLGCIVLNELAGQNEIAAVLTDKASEGIIEYCCRHNIRYFVGNPRKGKVQQLINELQIDVLLSINYLFLIERDLIAWPRLYAINFHGSLLPKYRGRTPHVWAIINNEKVSGITAHLIDEGCDTGDIVDQLVVPIEEEETGACILKKYIELYPMFIKKIVEGIRANSLNVRPQNHETATYYSKRTPEDGKINWEWQKERIKNWVRAQAFPYPGAFTFYGTEKVIVNKVVFSDMGYFDSIPNGTILKVESGIPIVKTQNGALLIKEFKASDNIIFERGSRFYERF